MTQRAGPPPSSASNILWFLLLSAAILLGHRLIVARFFPPAAPVAREDPEKAQKTVASKPGDADKPQPKEGKTPAAPAAADTEKPKPKAIPPKAEAEIAAPAAVQREWVTLGSASEDESNPYRMLVTLSNRGAAVARIELSSRDYRDLEDRSGYLGHLVMEEDGKAGAPVQVVGAGTPAADAGLKPGDRITAVDGDTVSDAVEFEEKMAATRPGQTVTLAVSRHGRQEEFDVTLIRRPLEMVRPERKKPQPVSTNPRLFDALDPARNSPLSLLATLEQFDEEKIAADEDAANPDLGAELEGVDLRTANWEVVKDQTNQYMAVFRRVLPERKLEVLKTYKLTPVAADAENGSAYHVSVSLEVKNLDGKAHTIAYRLDGPNGLPDEGSWYASKVSHTWSGAGLRDVVAQRWHTDVFQHTATQIADAGTLEFNQQTDRQFVFVGVDAQYFNATMIPSDETAPQIDQALALRVGEVDANRKNVTNTSFRLVSKPRELAPNESFTDEYTLFAGPKKPALLAEYGLGDVITYGWFGWVAKPMTQTLHFFYHVVSNYGLAIILLTVLVRLCMFPLSMKQARSAQKMQELQPEIKKIQEKFKKDPEGRMRAQQELFRKHSYNPLGGCLVLFVQLPIFIGLYRSLQVDVELRGAALLSHAVRWCSNLAAPDMLFDWSGFMPGFVSSGTGFFGLGPYFNLLPILTIGLFIVQQKMFMPPPVDEQAAMQQKMMNFMMIFMGLLFFKVAAGLCIYFIASSLWGIAERKFLPKAAPGGNSDGEDPHPASRSAWSAAARNGERIAARKKRRNRKK